MGLFWAPSAAKWRHLGLAHPVLVAEGFFDADELALASRLHAEVVVHSPWQVDLLAARPFGSALLTHIAATLQGWAVDDEAAASSVAHHPASTALVYYAAHDTNLLYLAELLGLKWLAKGWQPNHTPPGGMLVVEAYAP